MPPNYNPPTSYIRYRKPGEHDLEYVADAEDEVWLLNNAKFGVDSHRFDPNGRRRPQVTLAMLEQSLDLLEKNSGFETICLADRAERLILSKIPQFSHHFPYKAPAGVVTSKHVVGDIYSYWVQKRSKLKRPLLRRFWPVTASDDTNPHLVFRPREKEKYKLRKKRQNDMDAYRKMKQLRSDFQHVRVLLDLVKRREDLNRCMIQLQSDWFEQKLSDIVNTSGMPRISSFLQRNEVERLLDVPRYFNVTGAPMGSKKKKRKRGNDWDDLPFEPSTIPQAAFGGETEEPRSTVPVPPQAPVNVAGKNHGEPAPLFVQPLKTRESYVTSWDNAVPLITSYVNTHAAPTFRFRHRPRLGRGGRMCIDRIPHPVHPNITPESIFTAGDGLVCSVEPKKQLLDLLPRPLDHAVLSRKIEEMCVAAIQEDYETATAPTCAAPLDADENDCEEVLVKLNDWLDTDEQLWGEERFAIGPL
jgi:enhancer of polycomb-like protein